MGPVLDAQVEQELPRLTDIRAGGDAEVIHDTAPVDRRSQRIELLLRAQMIDAPPRAR